RRDIRSSFYESITKRSAESFGILFALLVPGIESSGLSSSLKGQLRFEGPDSMESTQDQSPMALPRDGLVPLEAILCTEELNRRPARSPDYETENRALVSLAQALGESPRTILQTLADKILEVFQTGSAGLSLLTKEDGGTRFYW